MIINSLTVHRLALTALTIVHKFYTDQFNLNSFISSLGGLHLDELNNLEEEFLDLIDFNLIVELDAFKVFQKSLNDFFE